MEFQPNVCPQANVETNKIILPSNILEENIYGALAELMHEAAHLRYTKNIPHKDIAPDELRHGILNAIEDIRIDLKNFNLLPNVKDFYEQNIDGDLRWREGKPIPLHQKVLCNAIYRIEDMPKRALFLDDETIAFERATPILDIVLKAISNLNYENWDGAKKNIDEIMKIFGLENVPKESKGEGAGGKGEGEGEDKNGSGKCPACNGTGKKGDTNEDCPLCCGKGKLSTDLSEVRDKKGMWATGQGNGSSPGTSELGEVAIEELTKNKFKEILNIKETRYVEEGSVISTDNLTSFFTGSIEELFQDEVIEKKKKSKVMILMDASGSMSGTLLDHVSRKSVVSGCVKVLAGILNEVNESEGIDVDWVPRAFTGGYHELKKESWEKEYQKLDGGTDLLGSFIKAQEELLNDHEIDGNKIVVIFTDGDVHESEIIDVKNRIIQNGEDIRCMIIGVGAEINGAFSKKIIGDNIILAKESADLVLLDTLITILGG